MGEIIPAILTQSVFDLKTKLASVQAFGARTVQIDFADNSFVPNKTIGIKECANIKTALALEAHVMVEHPEIYLENAKKKFGTFIFHIEAEPNPDALLKKIKQSGLASGIAINPKTTLSFIAPYVPKADMILFLSVEPGFQGRGFVASVISKIREFKHMFPEKRIGIDGGINLASLSMLKGLNIDEIVVGSGIWNDENPAQMYGKLKSEAEVL